WLKEFGNGGVTELCLTLPVVRRLLDRKRHTRDLPLRLEGAPEGQALRMRGLLAAAESYLRESFTEQKEKEARLAEERREKDARLAREREERTARLAAEQRAKLERQAAQHQKRLDAIRQMSAARSIRSLVHFTRLSNLQSILTHGLLARDALEAKLAHDKIGSIAINDQQRLDGQWGAVCLSVSFPNYLMFYKYRRSTTESWVVLTLHPSILWERDCLFCRENAASASMARLSSHSRREPKAFESMFEDLDGGVRARYELPDHYPTNPQAEVLVLESISPSYIREVHFQSPAALADWTAQATPQTVCRIRADELFFRPRLDWECWKSGPAVSPPEVSAEFSIDDIPF
ncbi:MAG: DarT ssDNA thymidine ADP-ribosyltransferase family protein, partial [Candidatus Eisenbacteria bacterium]